MGDKPKKFYKALSDCAQDRGHDNRTQAFVAWCHKGGEVLFYYEASESYSRGHLNDRHAFICYSVTGSCPEHALKDQRHRIALDESHQLSIRQWSRHVAITAQTTELARVQELPNKTRRVHRFSELAGMCHKRSNGLYSSRARNLPNQTQRNQH